MTEEANERINGWAKWAAQALIILVLGWGASSLSSLNTKIDASNKETNALANSIVRLEAQMEALSVVVGDRYTGSQAEADWRLQTNINAQHVELVERLDTRYNQWVSRLSDRLRAEEEATRRIMQTLGEAAVIPQSSLE